MIVKGLEDDTYSITETATDNGYRLLKENIQVVITAEESDNICPSCLAKTLEASATVDGQSVVMVADGDSASAVVPLTVINHRKTLIPGTGEAGNWLITIGGIALASASCMIFIWSLKRKTEHKGLTDAPVDNDSFRYCLHSKSWGSDLSADQRTCHQMSAGRDDYCSGKADNGFT